MTILTHRLPISLFLSLATAAITACAAVSEMPTYPSLLIQSLEYPNACTDAKKTALKNIIVASNAQNASDAWILIETVLCAPNDEPGQNYLLARLPKKLNLMSSHTGSKDLVMPLEGNRELAKSLLANAKAWNAYARIKPRNIDLNFAVDEACNKGIYMAFAEGKWMITGVGEGCD